MSPFASLTSRFNESAKTWARAEPPFAWLLLMVVASVFFGRLFWRATILPCADLPAHLALTVALRHLNDSSHVLGRTFRWGTFPAPNCAFNLLTVALSYFVSAMTAAKVAVLAYTVGTPWVLARLCRVLGRSRWPAVLAFPLVLEAPFTDGFVDYCLGIPLALFALAAAVQHLERPSVRRAAILALAAPLVLLAHIHTFVYFTVGYLILLVLRLVHAPPSNLLARTRTMIRDGFVAFSLPLLFVATWYARSPRSLEAQRTVETLRPTVERRIADLPFLTTHVLEGDADDAVTLSCVLAFVVLAGLVRAFGRSAPEGQRWTRWFPYLLFCSIVFGFLLLPENIGHYFRIHARMPLFAILVACLLAAPAGVSVRAVRLQLALAIVLAGSLRVVHARWSSSIRAYNDAMSGLVPTLRHAHKQSSLAYYPEPGMSAPGFYPWILRHLGQYHVALNEGTTSFSFAFYPGRIIVQRSLGGDFEFVTQGMFSSRERLSPYEYLEHYGPSKLEMLRPERFRVVHREGAWTLYRNLDFRPTAQ